MMARRVILRTVIACIALVLFAVLFIYSPGSSYEFSSKKLTATPQKIADEQPAKVQSPLTPTTKRHDDESKIKARFLHNIRMANLRFASPDLALPPEAIDAILDGRTADMLSILLPLVKAGDVDAARVLLYFGAACQESPNADASARHKDRVIKMAAQNGRSSDEITKFEWMSDDQEQQSRDYQQELCPAISKIGFRWSLFKLASSMTSGAPSNIENISAQDAENLDEKMKHGLALTGRPYYQYESGQALVKSDDVEKQREGIRLLELAAKDRPEATRELAFCKLRGCAGVYGNAHDGYGLLREAALSGDGLSLSLLGSNQAPDWLAGMTDDWSPSQAYAWRQFHDALASTGCLGGSFYSSWLTRPNDSKYLDTLFPASADQAKKLAIELLKEAPTTLQKMGC